MNKIINNNLKSCKVMKNHYDERKVLIELGRKNVKIDFNTRLLTVDNTTGTVGIHSWGKIDYLVKYCGWHVLCRSQQEIKALKEASDKAYKDAKKEAKKALKEAKLKKLEDAKDKKMIKSSMVKSGKELLKKIKFKK